MLSKKGKKNFIYSAPVVIIVVLVAFGILHGTINAYEKMKESQRKRALAEAELQDLTGRFDSIQQRVDYLKTEKGVDDAIRTKYNVVKEGEEVFVIIDNQVETNQKAENRSVWTIFWSKVTGVFR